MFVCNGILMGWMTTHMIFGLCLIMGYTTNKMLFGGKEWCETMGLGGPYYTQISSNIHLGKAIWNTTDKNLVPSCNTTSFLTNVHQYVPAPIFFRRRPSPQRRRPRGGPVWPNPRPSPCRPPRSSPDQWRHRARDAAGDSSRDPRVCWGFPDGWVGIPSGKLT